MDVQLKRGMLDACVLASVYQERSYGYAILKSLEGTVALSESTLYPILRRLESAGALEVESAEHNGRLRRYYAITQEGRQRVASFLEEWREAMDLYEFIRREVRAA